MTWPVSLSELLVLQEKLVVTLSGRLSGHGSGHGSGRTVGTVVVTFVGASLVLAVPSPERVQIAAWP